MKDLSRKKSSAREEDAINKAIRSEVLRSKRESVSSILMSYALREFLRLGDGRTWLKKVLRHYIKKNCKDFQALTYERLQKAYYDLVELMNRKYPITEERRTAFEKTLVKQFQKVSRRKIYTSVWIGGFCIDIFTPFCKVGKAKGLVYEIDGPKHDESIKMEKDRLKYALLDRLGIAVRTIKNPDVSSPEVFRELKGLSTFPTLDSRDKRNLWVKIYIETLSHLRNRVPPSRDPICTVLGVSPKNIDDMMAIVRNLKKGVELNLKPLEEMNNEHKAHRRKRRRVPFEPRIIVRRGKGGVCREHQ